ncbi:myosin heavy chain 95F isoform X1 [Coccinella septempunctata]|uniref:myosin heavy chain 95F isoform X1 n=1 Tax=Coccinella septempunctata TaxID=41139 RepID=UPI001D05CE96|nr:myosin heavy chain 95F isoform X1 [Coccinella septempunctata]
MDLVWARHPSEGFVLGRICEILGDEVEISPIDLKFPKMTIPYADIFPTSKEDINRDFDDNCEMMFLNEGSLLNNVRTRYYKNKIYTYVANILIAVNPYKEIPSLYSKETMKSYQGRSLGERPPHVFAIADKAFRDMKVLKQSQSIIVSGESGAGKTESTKHLLIYLCDMWGAHAGPIEQKILDANPVLEAFGNAKTTRNNNSSRFGKFIEVHFDKKFQVVGGHISHYLLEKSRICSPIGEERSYHIFYMLMAGGPEDLRKQLFLTKPDDFNYLKKGCTRFFTNSRSEKTLSANQKSADHLKNGPLRDILLDDVGDFQVLDEALDRLGLSQTDRFDIYKTVAAVLHLGNIEFEDDSDDRRGGCRVAQNKGNSLNIASKLLNIDPTDLRQALESRVMQSTRGGLKGTVIMVPLKVQEAINARDALAKAIYSNLFDHIVSCINQSIPFKASSYYVGVLDIAGFEFFTVNSFEQFCINYCNEKLQQFFNEKILKHEQDLYKREGLSVPEISYIDNQDCINLIEAKSKGILTLLDEESKLPKPSYVHFTNEVHKNWPNEFRLGLPRSSKLKLHRNLRDDEGFLIRHFAGAVCYQTIHFIHKNNDALHASLESIIQESKSNLIQKLFSNSMAQKGKLTFISVGNKFKTQLSELMEKLKLNGTNFIRCIKPNNKMVDNQFEGALSLMQLKCSGMTNVLELMEHGYPSRTEFADLYNMYKEYLPKELAVLKPKIFCEAMLHSLNLHEKDYKFGITRVFFRPGKFSEFDQIMKSDPENLRQMIGKIKKFLVKSRWLKCQFGILAVIKIKNIMKNRICSIILIQKQVRGYLVRRRYGPKIRLTRQLKSLDKRLASIQDNSVQIKSRENIDKAVQRMKVDITSTLQRIKTDQKLTETDCTNIFNKFENDVDVLRREVQRKLEEQKMAEEQARLKKIQEQMEREKKQREEEQRKKQEEEEMRKMKAELEIQRKKAEEERKKQEEAEAKLAQEHKERLEKEALEEKLYLERVEQERQDHELAFRLAQESDGQLEESPPLTRNSGVDSARQSFKLNRSDAVKNQQAALSKGKYDLSKWKYSDLRDTINTSCDIDLLEACRHEFHRRLKVYHAWKAKNQRRSIMNENERAPRSVMESANKTPRLQPKMNKDDNYKQRYFRIPFTRGDPNKKGFWFAHFDGQYVARQMELHPEKVPVLLIAGKDDMQMCELSLEETGLTRKRGAEILESEFEKEWSKNGGKPYSKPSDRKK